MVQVLKVLRILIRHLIRIRLLWEIDKEANRRYLEHPLRIMNQNLLNILDRFQ